MHSVSLKTLQTEAEALAVVCSCEHFHLYVYDVCPLCVLACALMPFSNLCSDLAEVGLSRGRIVRLEQNDPVLLLVSFISMNKFS